MIALDGAEDHHCTTMAKKKSATAGMSAGDFAAAVWPPDELPFIREVHAHPFDDAPRLVFADWLEERGDPRAEFIRVQCRLAQLRVRDPEYAALAERSQTLIEKHRADWLRPLPTLESNTWGIDGVPWNLNGRLSRHHFTRGFCASLHARSVGRFLAQPDLAIEELQVAIRTQREVRRLAADTRLERVGALLLKDSYEDLSALWSSPRLGRPWRIDVYQDSGLRPFLESDRGERLRWVHLSAADPGARPGISTLLDWANVEQLDTLSVDVRTASTLDLIGASRLRVSQFRVSILNITRQEATDALDRLAIASALAECVALRLENFQVQTLATMRLPPRVRWLSVSSALGALRATPISSPSFAQLERLELGGWGLQDSGAETLALCPHLTGLRCLELPGAEITARGARAILTSEALPNLERLNLRRTNIQVDERAALRKLFRGEIEF